MFQYAFAFRLASELAFRSGRAVELRAPKMPLSWAGMRDRVVPPPPGRRLAGRPRRPPPKKPAAASNCAVVTDRDRLSKLPLCAQLEAAFRSTTCVQVNGFFEDFGHLRGWRDEFRRLFAPAGRCGDTPPPGRDEVLVHVRECDQGSVDAPRPFFSAHGQVPWKFYDAVLRGIAARRQAAGRPPPTFTVLSPPSCGSSDLVKRLGSAFGATRRASPGATAVPCAASVALSSRERRPPFSPPTSPNFFTNTWFAAPALATRSPSSLSRRPAIRRTEAPVLLSGATAQERMASPT